MADDRLYNAAAALERLLLEQWGGPITPPVGGSVETSGGAR